MSVVVEKGGQKFDKGNVLTILISVKSRNPLSFSCICFLFSYVFLVGTTSHLAPRTSHLAPRTTTKTKQPKKGLTSEQTGELIGTLREAGKELSVAKELQALAPEATAILEGMGKAYHQNKIYQDDPDVMIQALYNSQLDDDARLAKACEVLGVDELTDDQKTAILAAHSIGLEGKTKREGAQVFCYNEEEKNKKYRRLRYKGAKEERKEIFTEEQTRKLLFHGIAGKMGENTKNKFKTFLLLFSEKYNKEYNKIRLSLNEKNDNLIIGKITLWILTVIVGGAVGDELGGTLSTMFGLGIGAIPYRIYATMKSMGPTIKNIFGLSDENLQKLYNKLQENVIKEQETNKTQEEIEDTGI